MEKELFAAACAAFGKCIGSKYCAEMVVELLMKEFAVSKEEADKVAKAAYKEWMEAYE
jgi:hypothetical protein